MMDPFFWSDHKVGRLTRDERTLVLGCIGHTDDKGRLEANPAYLKAMIFKYDDDLDITSVKELRDACLDKMQPWPVNHPYRMLLYCNTGEEYIFFPNFSATNKPSHPTESQLPSPPPDILPTFSGEKPEELQTSSGESPSQVRSGQSSLGQVRLGQVRAVQEDFTKFLDSEKDLTDFLMTRLKEYMPAAPQQAMSVVKQMWRQVTNVEMDSSSFQAIFPKLKTCPLQTFAASVVKSAKYSIGKKKPANYILAVFDDQMKGETRERSP